ncbi:MAG: hypothetical protein K1X55_10330 [Chitinophagales bacterium]|nr:hypothetical protein [Chitinophagales bacterium]
MHEILFNMEKEIDIHRIAKGFNDGYLVSQYDTGLADTLKGKVPEMQDEYMIGFQKGLVELEREKNLLDEFSRLRGDHRERGAGR